MAETRRTYAEGQFLLRDNTTQDISASELRDMVLASAFSHPVTVEVGTSYTLSELDRGKHLIFYNPTAIAVTLPAVGSAGLEDGWWVFLFNNNLGPATITSVSGINDFSRHTLVLYYGESAILFSSKNEFYTALPSTAIFNPGAGFTNLAPPRWTNLVFPDDYWAPAKLRANGVIPSSELHVSGIVEGLSAHLTIPGAATMALGGHAAAISGIARGSSSQVFPVGVYGQGHWTADAAGQNAWGGNFLVQNFGRSGTGIVGVEINVNATLPGLPTFAWGIFIDGASNSQPSGFSSAIRIGALGIFNSPVIPWQYGITTGPGDVIVGASFGPLANAPLQNSQTVEFVATDAANQNQISSIKATAGGGMCIDLDTPIAGFCVRGAIKKDNTGGVDFKFVPEVISDFVTGGILVGTNPDKISSGGILAAQLVYTVGQISLTAQTAAIAGTNIVTDLTAGHYRVTAYLHTTTPSTGASDSMITITYAYNGAGKAVILIPSHNHALDEGSTSATTSFLVQAGSAIAYAITLTGASTNAVYALDIMVEKLR